MYKRPSHRVKVHTSHIRGSIPDDTFIGRITKSKLTSQYKFVKRPVYHQDDYLKLLMIARMKILHVVEAKPTRVRMTYLLLMKMKPKSSNKFLI